MKNSILLFLFLIPTFLFAQYPTTGNKSRLGWQTTGDGLIWRGVAGDTVNKPNNRNYPYFQLDTVNAVLYRYIATQGGWQEIGGGVDIDSLIYATRYWTNSNFFPLPGGTLTGTGGSGFVGFPAQSTAPATPVSGFSLYAGAANNNISWIQSDGYFRRLISPVTSTPRQYQFMARSYTLADSADVAALPTGSGTTNYYAKWSSSTALGVGNLFDNNTYVGILNSKPFSPGQWTTAGRPTGTQGYLGYNTTTNGLDWYNGTRWATGLESTFARGTAGRPIFSDANGQATDDADWFWNSTSNFMGIGTASPAARLQLSGNQSAASWTTNGIGLRSDAATYTNTTSSGTVAAQYIHAIGTPTLTASSSTTLTNSATLAILAAPVSSTNITQTNSWAIFSPSGQSRFSRVVAGEPGINATGLINSYYLTSHLHAYGGNDGTSRAAITAQSLGNAAGLTKIGVIGNGALGSGGTNGTVYGVIGEAGVSQNMTSGTVAGILGYNRTNGATANLYGVKSQVDFVSTVSGGSVSSYAAGFYGDFPQRNNNGVTLIQGYRWAGITAGSVAGLQTGIENYNPLAINRGSGTLSGVSNIWSYIDHKTSIGSATQGNEELDVFGDAYIRDSTRLTTTPAHSSITGLLTRDANGWVGLATLSGLSYAAGILSATYGTGTARTIPFHNNSGAYTYNTSFKLDTTTTAGALAKYKLNINNPSNLTGEGDSYQVFATYAGDAATTAGMFHVGDQATTMATAGYSSTFQLYRTAGTFASKSNIAATNIIGQYDWRGQVNGSSTLLSRISSTYQGTGTNSRSRIDFDVSTSTGLTRGLVIDSSAQVQIPVTPAHSAISGILTKSSGNVVGVATLAGGLSYSGGVLTGLNGIYSGSGTVPTGTRAYIAPTSTFQLGRFTGSITDPLLNRVNAMGLMIYPSIGVQALVYRDSTNNTASGLFQTNTQSATSYTGYNGLSGYTATSQSSTTGASLVYSIATAFKSRENRVRLDSTSFKIIQGLTTSTSDTVLNITLDAANRGSLRAYKYGTGNKEASDLSKTVSAYASVYATDGTLLEYPLADLGGSSILDSLPNGSISLDANGNSLNISNLDELSLTGYSADIRGQNSRLLLDDDDATLSADNNVDISAAGELTLTGLVVALQEAYYEVTSTTSPDTLSNVYSDNLINQGGTQATFTLVLPPSPIDGQVCTITYVNNITTLTLDGNGTTVIGSAVTTGVPGSQRKYKYYAAAGAWVKIY